MRKRTESNLVTACLKWLQVMENLGKIAWCDRMNTGKVFIPRGNKGRIIRLHRAGTPDIMIVTNEGSLIWVECKQDDGQQSEDQVKFQNMVKRFSYHKYFIIRSCDYLVEVLATKGITA